MKKNLIITISREYGSGGGEIGRKLSKALGIPCYDKELLTIAPKKVVIAKSFEKYDETNKIIELLLI
ncbi:MAG: cytidylate kinase family protein [Intestinibacter sp.]